MGGSSRTCPAGDHFCRACGLTLVTHLRCSGCGILAGPSHLELSLASGLCSTCARRDPKLRSGRADFDRLSVEITNDAPTVLDVERRRSRFY